MGAVDTKQLKIAGLTALVCFLITQDMRTTMFVGAANLGAALIL